MIFVIVVIVFLGAGVAYAIFLRFVLRAKERKFKGTAGRTQRVFQSDKHVWEIMDIWAQMRKYSLVEQDEHSRRYESERHGYWRSYYGTYVLMTKNDEGYQLEAWVSTRSLANITFGMSALPNEIDIEKRDEWSWDPKPLDIARSDVNNLIDMLDAGIDPVS